MVSQLVQIHPKRKNWIGILDQNGLKISIQKFPTGLVKPKLPFSNTQIDLFCPQNCYFFWSIQKKDLKFQKFFRIWDPRFDPTKIQQLSIEKKTSQDFKGHPPS